MPPAPRSVLLGLALGAVALSSSSAPSHAQGVGNSQAIVGERLTPLLERLGNYALRFEEMEKRGSFLLQAQMDELDGKGHVDGTKELVLRVTATPSQRFTEILKYLEDGADKTDEARTKAAKAAKKADDPKKKLRLPFLPSEQARYTFAITARHPRFVKQARVVFRPVVPAENTFAGSAWVDEPSGEILTLGFSPSETPLFIDHVDIQMRFDHLTSLGRAPSSLSFEARGGLLFIKKHYRGSVTLLEPQIAF